MILRMIILFIMVAASAYSQVKYEREYTLQTRDVPETAKSFIGQITTNNIKWYGEESQDGTTVEAKFNYRSHKHSIEFDKNGNLLDTEILIECDEIPEEVQRQFLSELKELFKSHKIRKIQRQLITETSELALQLIRGEQDVPHELNYEMIIKGRTENNVNLYEITFDGAGKLMEKQIITFSTSDHLVY